MVKRLLLGAVAAAALAGPASALTLMNPVIVNGNAIFGASDITTNGAFVHTFTFNYQASSATADISTVLLAGANPRDVDFTSVTLDGFAFVQQQGDPREYWALPSPVTLTSGAHTLIVKGRVSGVTATQAASYSGNLNLGAVPEPATWGMMILGFGVAGATMRRRRTTPVVA